MAVERARIRRWLWRGSLAAAGLALALAAAVVCLPVVAFDLVETRVSAAGAAVYAEPNRVDAFAEAVLDLLGDEVRRKEMGAAGRRRVEEVLAWGNQIPSYVHVYDRLLGR